MRQPILPTLPQNEQTALDQALQRAEAAEARARRLADLLHLGEQLQTMLLARFDLSEVLKILVEQIGRAVDATSAYLCSVDADLQQITVVAEYFGPAAHANERISDLGVTYDGPRDFPTSIECLRSGVPRQYLADDAFLGEHLYAHLRRFGCQALLLIPLFIKNQPTAYAAVWESRYQRVFSDDEVALAHQIAQYGALALHNARMYEQAQQEIAERARAEAALRESEHRYRELFVAAQLQADELALSEHVQLALLSNLDLGLLLRKMAEQMCRALDVTSVYIARYDAEQLHVTVIAEYFGPDAKPRERSSDLGITYNVLETFPNIVAALKQQRPVIYHAYDPDVDPETGVHIRAFDGNTALQLPIMVDDEMVAFASLWESRRRREFSAAEITLIQRIARYAGIALKNASLYEQARQEIAERTRVEAALRRSEAKNQALVQAIPDVMLRFDYAGRMLDAKNDKAGNLVLPPEQLLGKLVSEVIPLDLAARSLSYTRRAVETGELQHYEYQLEIDGQLRDFEARVAACGNDEALALIRDITPRKRLERELIAAREAALESARLKSAFLANVSHEIRTPMNGVIGMLDLLRASPLTPDQASYARIASSSGRALLALVDDILDFSKIEAGKFSLRPLVFDLRALIDEVVVPFAEPALQAGLKLHVDLAADLPRWLHGDALRLRQVLTNLLGNALKFTPQGTVTLRAGVLPSATADESGVVLRFDVEDTGIGMSQDQIELLFQPFSQIDSSMTRRYGGSGLGLAISRQIADLMGGSIQVTSWPERGSTFRFTLRFDLAHPDAITQVAEAVPEHLSRPVGRPQVLVVEDNAVNQLVVVRQLERLGVEAQVTSNGVRALQLLEQQRYDLIFMDIQMPELDGLATTAAIRAREGPQHTPIVALTAHAMDGERLRCLAAGMDDYLAKPITQEDLARVLGRWLNTLLPVATLDDELLGQIRQLEAQGAAHLLAELSALFNQDTPPRLQSLREAISSGDGEALARIAHTLKGSTGNLGAQQMMALCQTLEAQSQDLAAAALTLAMIEQEFERVKQALAAELL